MPKLDEKKGGQGGAEAVPLQDDFVYTKSILALHAKKAKKC